MVGIFLRKIRNTTENIINTKIKIRLERINIEAEITIKDLQDGVKIMSIESRYLFKEQDKELGYDSTVFWNKEKRVLPRKLYQVKLPYSLGMIHWFKMKTAIFKKIENYVYSNDIINVSFNRASKTKVLDEDKNIKYKPQIRVNKKRYSFDLVEELKVDKSIDALRNSIYNGFVLDGEKYVLFMRSPGKARVGEVLYIREELFDDFIVWARMGIDFNNIEDVVDVAGLKAAESLVLSSIKDEIAIKENEILLIPDVKVPYKMIKGKASITRMGTDGMAETFDNKEEVVIENDIFDGQSLLVPEYFHDGKSMLLLRNRFFKSAAFCFDIQQWFKDNNITDASQLNGYTLANKIEDIKLITTPNSLKFMKQKKYIKFDCAVKDLQYATFKYWLQNIKEDGSIFGVVKNEYDSGFVKRYNYQVNNSLNLTIGDMRELLQYEFGRILRAKNNNDYFVNEFIEKREHHKIDNNYFRKKRFDNCVCELYKLNSDIQYTQFFKNYKNNMLQDYKNLLKFGKYKLEDSDYCVVCSNPFEMMQHACNISQNKWVRIHHGREAYCKYYFNEQDIIATRSPHIYSGNVVCLHNKYHSWFDQYMKLSDNIVVINSIESDIMDRCNSMDFDSDTLLLSSNSILVREAKYCEENFPTPICQIKPFPKQRYYRIEDFADCDKTIADAKIGEIVNLSQFLQSYYHEVRLNTDIDSEKKKKILEYLKNQISKLASLSGCEIDRAKRDFPVDTDKELNKIRNYIANYKNEDNLLHGIVKTGNVKYIMKSVKKKYLQENPDISEDEKEDYDIVQKVIKLNEKNNSNIELLSEITDSEELKEQKKIIADNNKKIDELLKSRTKVKSDVLARPKFFKEVFPYNEKVYYTSFNCPMDYLEDILETEYPRKNRKKKKDENGNTIPKMKLIDFFDKPIEYNKVTKKLKRGNDKHVKQIIEIANKYEKQRKALYGNNNKNAGLEFDAETEKRELFEKAVNEVSEMKLTKQTIYNIINMLYGSNQAKSHNNGANQCGKVIMDILYNAHKNLVLSLFKKNQQEVNECNKVS